MRADRTYLCAGLACLLLDGIALPQSLADVARKAEEERQKTKSVSKVYTNDDLRRDPNSPVAPVSAPGTHPTTDAPKPAPAPADASKTDGKGAAAQEPIKDEKYWKDRMTAARAQLTRSTLLLDALQTRVNSLSADMASQADPARRALLERARQDALRETERLKKELQDQTKAIADIEEEARRTNVPPGWLR